MGIQLLCWAWEQRVGDPSRKLLLVKIAESANDETGETWWKLSYFAGKCEISVRTARRHLAALVRKGILTTEARYRKDGSQTSNVFRFTPVKAQFEPRVNPPPVTDDTPPGHGRPAPRTPVTGTPDTGDTGAGHGRQGGRSPVTGHEPKVVPSVSPSPSPVPRSKGISSVSAPQRHTQPDQNVEGMAAWEELQEYLKRLDRWDGRHPLEEPRPEVKEAFDRIGGYNRWKAWDKRPQDFLFARKEFLNVYGKRKAS